MRENHQNVSLSPTQLGQLTNSYILYILALKGNVSNATEFCSHPVRDYLLFCIQLPEYLIPAPVSQKAPYPDILKTESGIIDPLVSKRPETNQNNKKNTHGLTRQYILLCKKKSSQSLQL